MSMLAAVYLASHPEAELNDPSANGTAETWRAEWAASPALQAEFSDVGDYLALRKAEYAGRVKL